MHNNLSFLRGTSQGLTLLSTRSRTLLLACSFSGEVVVVAFATPVDKFPTTLRLLVEEPLLVITSTGPFYSRLLARIWNVWN